MRVFTVVKEKSQVLGFLLHNIKNLVELCTVLQYISCNIPDWKVCILHLQAEMA